MAAASTLTGSLAACTGPDAPPPGARPHVSRATLAAPPEDAGPAAWGRVVCEDLPTEWLRRIERGYHEQRSGEVQIVPAFPNQIDPGLPHNGPWPQVQEVPLFFYGPGVVPVTGRVARPVTVADVAPTVAALAGERFDAPDGRVLSEVVGATPPRVIVVVIWDAVGREVLARHPDAWPTLASLIDDGVWFERATVGSSPSQTAQVHATIGTGAFPRTHGLVAHRFRVDGELVTPWGEGTGLLEVPTVGDELDRRSGNEREVGFVGTLMIHLGLLGHGSDHPGGDADLAVLREREDATTLGAEAEVWNLPDPVDGAFRFPTYVHDVRPGLDSDVERLDAADGERDGRWRDNEIAPLLDGFDTPARAPYQQRVVEAVVRREGFGDDALTDLLWVNEKFTDYVSHVWSVDSVEMDDAVRAQDDALARLITFLDATVGRGAWALALTADHGSVRDPAVTGGAVLSSSALQEEIEGRFGPDTVELVQDTQLYLAGDRLRAQGSDVDDVARFVGGLTAGDLTRGTQVPSERAAAPAFRAAFPSEALSALPCVRERTS